MTTKQQLFVAEYLVDLNATQAAIRAGYSKKTAAQIGEQNLRKLVVATAIAKALEARAERTEVTQDRVLEELALIGFAEMPDEPALKWADKLTALDKLAKHLGMFTERHHHSSEIVSKAPAMSDRELLERATHIVNRVGPLVNGAKIAAHTNGRSCLPPHTP